MDIKKMIEVINNSRFCVAKDGGEGYVDKSECVCNGMCQEIKDRERFHKRFEELGMDWKAESISKERNRIIQIIKPEFEDSKWWKDNVLG